MKQILMIVLLAVSMSAMAQMPYRGDKSVYELELKSPGKKINLTYTDAGSFVRFSMNTIKGYTEGELLIACTNVTLTNVGVFEGCISYVGRGYYTQEKYWVDIIIVQGISYPYESAILFGLRNNVTVTLSLY